MFIVKIMSLFVLTGDSLRRRIRNKPTVVLDSYWEEASFNVRQLERNAFQMGKMGRTDM